MKQLTVNLPGREYDILMEHGILNAAGEHCKAALPKATRLAVVTDSTVGPLYARRVLKSLEAAGFLTACITIPAGERSKSVSMLGTLYEELMAFGLTRTDAVVALGGGVVGDLCGFAAATILRGVDFVQIPTTLLSQVDSSVGGKVAIDLAAGKNLAGAFHQPKLVLMDPTVLGTLDDATFSDGMAEVVKYGCILDETFFTYLEQHPSRSELMVDIEYVLYSCCDMKRKVVIEDEYDTGARMLLNFGHTLGHAYEKAGHYEAWSHGQAVAAGMVRVLELGAALGITPAELSGRVAVLLAAFGLPIAIACSKEDYRSAIGLDKKGEGDEITLILLTDLGCAIGHKIAKAQMLELL